MGHIVGCRTFETWNYFGCNANELSSIQILNMDVSLQQQWTKTQALNVNPPWGPLYTESRQRCSNAGTPDQLGIATHIWSDLLGVLRDQKATHRSDIAWRQSPVADAQCKWALTLSQTLLMCISVIVRISAMSSIGSALVGFRAEAPSAVPVGLFASALLACLMGAILILDAKVSQFKPKCILFQLFFCVRFWKISVYAHSTLKFCRDPFWAILLKKWAMGVFFSDTQFHISIA